jgi:5-methylcytosine-specific restriction protein A
VAINQIRDDVAPTADSTKLERATKLLLASGTFGEPRGVARPAKLEVSQETFVRDPRVRAWVLATANGLCEACTNPARSSPTMALRFLRCTM